MLRIHDGFPIKKMALYGSAAFIVGFTGTLTMLRGYVPKSETGGTSVVHPTNKDQATSNLSNQVPKEAAEHTTLDPAAPLAESTPTAANETLTTRQASPGPLTRSGGSVAGGSAPTVQSAPTSTTTAPSVATSPQPSGSSSSSAPATQQPAPVTTIQPVTPLIPVSGLQQTVDTVEGATGLLP